MVEPDPALPDPGGPAAEVNAEDAASTCPWCASPTPAGAARCPACDAALAQREAIGDLMIPGLTSVDPALQDYDKRPLHLRGPSPSQGVASALIAGAVAGGPVGVAAIGGVAAVAAAEYLGAGRGGQAPTDLDSVGKPSEVILQALDRLEDGTLAQPSADAPADRVPPGAPEPSAAADDGLSIWRDLPRPAVSDKDDDQEDIDAR